MNAPAPPFSTPYCVELQVNLDDAADDARRIMGESWCCRNAKSRWFRSVDKLKQTVRFSFHCRRDAVHFWLAN